jgi:enamine deaminase RidA (YjgF/YER057c/UK114 family)
MADTRNINPWTWQDQFGFSQAVEVSGGQRVVYCAGQTSVDADGKPVHEGDMGAQAQLALDNLEQVLSEAGLSLSDVVRLTYYTTDVDAFIGSLGAVTQRLGTRPASTLLGVARLARPELLVEIEATAVG